MCVNHEKGIKKRDEKISTGSWRKRLKLEEMKMRTILRFHPRWIFLIHISHLNLSSRTTNKPSRVGLKEKENSDYFGFEILNACLLFN